MDEWQMPRRATRGSAGYDFVSPKDYCLEPGKWLTIDTGVRLEYIMADSDRDCPWQWVMLLAPRSSMGFRYGLRFANTIGVIDSDYPDTIRACVTVDKRCILKRGERFMQGIIVPFLSLDGEIPPTEERTGGIGSTGQ